MTDPVLRFRRERDEAIARCDALAAELADWQRMRNEAMAVATSNRARIRELEAALTLLTNGFKYSTEVVTIAREALGIEITATSETKTAPGFCPECLMTGGHKLRCSKAETKGE